LIFKFRFPSDYPNGCLGMENINLSLSKGSLINETAIFQDLTRRLVDESKALVGQPMIFILSGTHYHISKLNCNLRKTERMDG
jgi:hypothetical protein